MKWALKSRNIPEEQNSKKLLIWKWHSIKWIKIHPQPIQLNFVWEPKRVNYDQYPHGHITITTPTLQANITNDQCIHRLFSFIRFNNHVQRCKTRFHSATSWEMTLFHLFQSTKTSHIEGLLFGEISNGNSMCCNSNSNVSCYPWSIFSSLFGCWNSKNSAFWNVTLGLQILQILTFWIPPWVGRIWKPAGG